MGLEGVESCKVAEIRSSEVSLAVFNVDGEVYLTASIQIAVLPETIRYLGEVAIDIDN